MFKHGSRGGGMLDKVAGTTNISRNAPKINGQPRQPLSSGAYFAANPKPLSKTTHRPNPDLSEYPLHRQMKSKQPAQNRRIAHDKPVHIDVYRDMIKMTTPDYANGKTGRPGADRGVIKGFSRASRKRMIEFMASMRGETGDMYFVTMTYDDWSWLRKHDDHTRDFEAFRKRFQRAFPNWRAIWRVEVKERKSGMLTGSRVPHFHLLVFTGRNDDGDTKTANVEGLQEWGVSAWGEILQTENPHFAEYGFHVGEVKNRKHAYSYVSKYIGKIDDDTISCGRRWGRIGRFDTSSSESFILTFDEAIELKRIVRRWIRNKKRELSRKFAKYPATAGFTLFGLGDTPTGHTDIGIFNGAWQLVSAAKQAARNKRHGDHWQPG